MKRIIRGLIWLLLAVSCAFVLTNARAQTAPDVVGLHLVSYHFNPGGHLPTAHRWNNINPGFYMRWDSGLTIGALKNSRRNHSMYVGWTLETPEKMFAVTVGIIDGYDKLAPSQTYVRRCAKECRMVSVKDTVSPMVIPSLRIPLDAVGLDNSALRVALVKAPGTAAAVHLMAEHRF